MTKDVRGKRGAAAGRDKPTARWGAGTARTVLALAAVALVTASAAAGARSWLTPSGEAGETAKAKSIADAGVRDDPSPLPADVAFTSLNSSGFAPSEIAHEAGRFRIVVQNKSGEATLDLRLNGEADSRFTERHTLGDVQGWTAEVELGAGEYTITEARHPDRVCHLTVQ